METSGWRKEFQKKCLFIKHYVCLEALASVVYRFIIIVNPLVCDLSCFNVLMTKKGGRGRKRVALIQM